MGVSGLWEILAPAGKSCSLTKLAVEAFVQNSSDKRACRVGIDASIWFNHIPRSREGENPELRLLFFRVASLARLPFLPIFVFDGRNRPKIKRGSKIGKSGAHSLTTNFKKLLEAFGMEYREAEGEAEAELAYLNQAGIIDAVVTDDVDAFLFGATTIMRNWSLHLTGNKANPALDSAGKLSKVHTMVFKAVDLRDNPQIRMTQGGMILFALLTGGDYDKGVDKIGSKIAYALIRCGFGDELYGAALNRHNTALHNFLPGWRNRLNAELRENSKGYLSRAYPGLCLPDSFPNLELLDKYVEPARRTRGLQGVWKLHKELSLKQAAGFCEKYFEWGTRSKIINRFRTLLWEACIIRVLRRAALEQDNKEANKRYDAGIPDRKIRGCPRPGASDAVGTSISLIPQYLGADKIGSDLDRISSGFVNKGPSTNTNPIGARDPESFIVKIHSQRQHVSTDAILEYRIEVDPTALVEVTNSGIKGTRPDKDLPGSTTCEGHGEEKASGHPLTTFRMWCPASMLWRIDPRLVEEYELAQEEKKQKKTRKGTGARDASNGKGNGKGKRRATANSGTDSETDAGAEEYQTRWQSSPQKRRKSSTSHNDQLEQAIAGPSRFSGNSLVQTHPTRLQQSTPEMTPAEPTRAFRLNNHYKNNSQTFSSISAPPMTPLAAARQAGKISRTHKPSLPLLRSSPQSFSQARDVTSQLPYAADDWDADDISSFFIYEIKDPCNPDHIDREDMCLRGPEPAFTWADISKGVKIRSNHSDSDDSDLDSDQIDLRLQRSFMIKAEKTNKSFELQSTAHSSNISKGKANATTHSVFNKKAASIPSILNTSRERKFSHSSIEKGPENPLFLRSPTPPKRSLSHYISQLSRRASLDAEMIEVSSSDEDEEAIPGSSQVPPPSSVAASSSPHSSQGRYQDFYGRSNEARSSQLNLHNIDSRTTMLDDDDISW